MRCDPARAGASAVEPAQTEAQVKASQRSCRRRRSRKRRRTRMRSRRPKGRRRRKNKRSRASAAGAGAGATNECAGAEGAAGAATQ